MNEFKLAKYKDIFRIQQFIHENFKEDHVLSKSKALFVFEYFDLTNNLNPNSSINMFIYEKNDEIQAILGFYNYTNEYYLSLWSAKKGTLYGLLILKEAEKVLSDKPINVLGLSEQAIHLYQKLGYRVEELNFQYLKRIPKASFRVNGQELTELLLLEKKIEQIENNYHFYKKRLFNNPFQKYYYYFFDEKDILYIYKKIETKINKFLLVVDILGDINQVSVDDLQEIMLHTNYDFITIYSNEKICGMNNVYESQYIFSIYNAPYVNENIKLHYAYKKNKPLVFKLRGDQERPAVLNQKFALVNNFMYHYVRDNTIEQNVNNYISCSEFVNHVSYLKKNYENLKLNHLLEGNFDEKKEFFMISFDDAYKEHFEFVRVILEKNEIEGHFFIPLISDETLLEVNKIHQILNWYAPQEIIEKIKLKESQQSFIEKYELYSNVESLDKPEIIFIKRYLQKENNAQGIIRELFESIPKERYVNYYISQQELEVLSQKHIIGNHTCQHRHLTDYTKEEIENDINEFEKIMKPYLHIKTISYPFGSRTKEIVDVYYNHGYVLGWNVIPSYAIIPENGCLDINRYDAIDLSRYIEELGRVK